MSDQDEDEFLYGSEAPEAKRLKNEEQMQGVEEEQEGVANEYSDDSSDSDVEFVINTGQKAQPPQPQAAYSTAKDEKKEEAKDASTADAESSTTETSTTQQQPQQAGLDISAVGEYNGQKITDISMENFEKKPWRMPGADITDYFNYGFDEMSWIQYCGKQDEMAYTKQTGAAPFNFPFPMMPGMMPGFMPNQAGGGNNQQFNPQQFQQMMQQPQPQQTQQPAQQPQAYGNNAQNVQQQNNKRRR